MAKINESKTYVEFLLEKGSSYNLETIFEEQKNSSLLKEFSFKMIEEETTLGEIVDLLKSHNVHLPNMRYLNEAHEEKIYNLGLSLYSSIFVQKTLDELKEKVRKLETLSVEIEEIGSIEDTKEIKDEIKKNTENIKELTLASVEQFSSLLDSSKKVDSFILGEDEDTLNVSKVSKKDQKEARNILSELESEKEPPHGLSSFIKEVRESIDRVDVLIGKCQTIIEGNSIASEIENAQIINSFKPSGEENIKEEKPSPFQGNIHVKTGEEDVDEPITISFNEEEFLKVTKKSNEEKRANQEVSYKEEEPSPKI